MSDDRGRTSSLTTRLLLESVVVIGSILVAFAIDAWWDGQGDRQAEHALLARLHADFVAMEPELEAVRAEHLEQRDACLSLLEMLSIGDPLPMSREVDRLIAFAFIGTRTFRPGSGSVEAFLNSDGSRLLRNQRLADLLVRWSGLVEELQEEEDQLMKGSTERWVPYLAAQTNLAPYLVVFEGEAPSLELIPRAQLAPERRPAVMVDQGFLNQVIERLMFETLALRDLTPLQAALQEILTLLEVEIAAS